MAVPAPLSRREKSQIRQEPTSKPDAVPSPARQPEGAVPLSGGVGAAPGRGAAPRGALALCGPAAAAPEAHGEHLHVLQRGRCLRLGGAAAAAAAAETPEAEIALGLGSEKDCRRRR